MDRQLSFVWEQDGLLEYIREPRTLPELATHLAGPPETSEHRFRTWAYSERWCAMHNRAWTAVCALLRDGRVQRIQPSPLDTPRWQTTPTTDNKGALPMLNPTPATTTSGEA